MPCYNCAKYISNAIESILSQTFPYFEFIIINDGSTDATESKIRKWKDNRIYYTRFYTNKGNSTARNVGLRLAKGEYICIMDGDDVSMPDRLQKQYDFLEKNPQIGAIGSNSSLINNKDQEIGTCSRPLEYDKIKVLFLKNNFLIHPSVMIRSELISKYSLYYDKSFIYASDYDLFVRAAQSFPINNLSDILIKYRIHSSQISIANKIKQEYFADKIRLNQLKYLGVTYTQSEANMHLELIKGRLINSISIDIYFNWLYKINHANKHTNIYDKRLLYNFTQNLLLRATHDRNSDVNLPFNYKTI